jgi:hypothetical protein
MNMESRKAPAAHGWTWIRNGFWLFRKSPLLWMVLTSIGVVGLFGISTIPVVGDPLSSLLFPPILAGYMLGCHALASGEELELAHLFAGFQRFAAKLVTLGGINLIGQLLIMGIMMLTGGEAVVDAMMSGKTGTEDPGVLIAAFQGAGFAILLGTALFTVLLMAMQFAPMLVVFRNMAPLPAMRASLRAFLQNWLPLTVYCVLLIPFAIVASLPIMLGWIILLPIIITSLYAIYRDVFPMPEDITHEAANASGEEAHF